MIYLFLNNILNLKGNCVLRYFLSVTDIHTHIHTYKLVRRTERLVRERRTGTTMQTAEQLQELIDKDLILENLTTSYSLETVRATLASLCPPAYHRDILNSAQLASIAQSTPPTVSAGDVMAVLKKLPIGRGSHEGPLPSQRGLQ